MSILIYSGIILSLVEYTGFLRYSESWTYFNILNNFFGFELIFLCAVIEMAKCVTRTLEFHWNFCSNSQAYSLGIHSKRKIVGCGREGGGGGVVEM